MTKTIEKAGFSATIEVSGRDKCLTALQLKESYEERCLDLNAYPELRDINLIGRLNISYPASYSNPGSRIDRLVLPDVVREVDYEAFVCSMIRTLVWPTLCHAIPSGAFKYSLINRLCNIENVTKIGKEAFLGCGIESIEIPDGITEIPQDCFLSSNLASITGCRNVTTIQESAFNDCKLTEFKIPDKVSVIPYKGFYSCKNLASLPGLDHVRIFEPEAFADCVALKSVQLNGAVEIKERAFYHSGLEKDLDLTSSMCVNIEKLAFANTSIENYSPGYFLKSVNSMAFRNTPYSKKNKAKKK